jgi:allantoate deiminase
MRALDVIRKCHILAGCTEEPGHITRRFLTPPMVRVHELVRAWMEAAGLQVRLDAVGNLRGVSGEGPRLMIGSHLDTVPDAGAFDGILGVIIGIALAEARPGHRSVPLELVGFSEEEGVGVGVPFIGSRALVGDPVMSEPVLAAIRGYGLDPAEIPRAAIGSEVRGYLEFHIEQGPVLENLGLPLGVVEAIAGQSRFEVGFTGKANHAGTTPMNLRHDALAGAAEWIGLVEREGSGTPGLVATVGRIDAQPGAPNVIPGLVKASLDVRHAQDDVRVRAAQRILSGAREIALRRGLSVKWEQKMDQPAVAMACEAMEMAVAAAGYPVHRMVSGAGHDAMVMARKVPASMLFLRSPGGISHHPDEAVLAEDVTAALAVGMKFLEGWTMKFLEGWKPL